MKKILDFVERNLGYIMLVIAALGILTFCVSCSSDDNPIEEEPTVVNLDGTTWEYSYEDNMWMIDRIVLHFVDDKKVKGWYEGRKGMNEEFVKYDIVSCSYYYDKDNKYFVFVGGMIFNQFNIDETHLNNASVTDNGLIVSRTVIHSFGLNKDSEPVLFTVKR